MLDKVFIISVILGATLALKVTTQPPQANCDPAPQCDTTVCVLPACSCSGEELAVPDYTQRPQIIYMSYDDAFTGYAESNYYSGIFDGTFKNPDGGDIRATHFLTAQYTDYTLVHDYWAMGHEMASHSVTHRTDMNYWKGLNVDGWSEEVTGMRKMITQFAAIPKADITGYRSPFLQMGADEMFAALKNDGFKYDCSWVSRDYGYLDLDQGLFPYTLDYESVQDCPIKPCPTCAFEGLWVQPMLDLEDNWIGANPQLPDNGMPCSMLDGCIIMDEEPTRDTVKEMLMKNFIRNREGTRAPMGLFMHAAWFASEELIWHYDGYKDFIQEVTATYDDVWFIPVIDGLDYFQNYNNYTNTDILALGDASPFSKAKYADRPTSHTCEPLAPCQYDDVHNEDINGGQRFMPICKKKVNGQNQSCPDEYPWLTNPCGGNTPCA